MAVSINQKPEQIVLQMTLENFTCIIQMIKVDTSREHTATASMNNHRLYS